MKQKVILLGLNEINFEFVKEYCTQGYLPNFKKLIDKGWTVTTSENEYRLFEPWIQWVTVHTGKAYSDHQIFRLGDIISRKDLRQLFEELEALDFKVGAVSPFNAENRLKNAPFFVPDPWTKTPATGSKLLKKLAAAVQQTVNDNAQSKMTMGSVWTILEGLLAYVPVSRYASYFSLATKIKKPGVRAMILDNLLSDVFLFQWKKHQPDFSSLFLNAAAHIQHHYLFNSSAYKGEFSNPEWYCPAGYDPLILALKEYDKLLGRLLSLNTIIYLVTGLHQRPHEELTYYWRLKDHKEFMTKIGLNNYLEILPRMSRDFLMEFKSEKDAIVAAEMLDAFYMQANGEKIFEIDNRGKSLFIELIYPNALDEEMAVTDGKTTVLGFKNYVAFVAIKNGEHDGTGYLLSNNGLSKGVIPLTEVYHILKGNFVDEKAKSLNKV